MATGLIKSLEQVRKYVQRDYWKSGISKGVSGYEDFQIDYWWNGRLLQTMDKAWGPLYDKKLLDLGCAYGQVVAVASLWGMDAYGIDLSDYAIEQGIKEAGWLKDRIFQGSIHDLSRFPGDEFDILYSCQVFEHLPGEFCGQLAEETYRVAKPGGFLWASLVIDIHEDFQPQGFNPEDGDDTHINIRPYHWWDERFLAAGWKKAPRIDRQFRQARTSPDNFSFFEEYGWHSLCYQK